MSTNLLVRSARRSVSAIRHGLPLFSGLLVALATSGCVAGAGSDSAPVDEAPGVAPETVGGSTCVTIQRGTFGNVEDAHINFASPTKNYGSSAGLTSDPSRIAQLRFDVSFIPSTAVIDSATVTLKAYLSGDSHGGVAYFLYAGSSGAWTESTLTASNWQDFQLYETQFPFAAPGQTTSFDLTQRVGEWVSGYSFNDGVALSNTARSFWSSEATTVADRPRMLVCYH